MLQDIFKAMDRIFRFYIMRDVLSIMAPGILLIIAAIFYSTSKSEIGIQSIIEVFGNLSLKSILLLSVFSYPVGFSIFSLGETLGWIRICERKGGPLGFNKGSDWKEDLANHFKMEKQLKLDKADRIYDERLAILRQMMATFFISIVLIFILAIDNYCINNIDGIFCYLNIDTLFVIIVMIGLWVGNRRLVIRHRIWRESRLS